MIWSLNINRTGTRSVCLILSMSRMWRCLISEWVIKYPVRYDILSPIRQSSGSWPMMSAWGSAVRASLTPVRKARVYDARLRRHFELSTGLKGSSASAVMSSSLISPESFQERPWVKVGWSPPNWLISRKRDLHARVNPPNVLSTPAWGTVCEDATEWR
jgi:hypothetical protein